MSDLEILDSSTVEPDFFPPATTGALDLLLAQYAGMRARIEQVADLVTGETAGAVSYFLEAHKVDGRRGAWPAVDKLFDPAPAVAALNAAYWSKALALTDVLDAMPQKRRDEWHKDITEHRCPDFEEGTVKATLSDLLASRARFFAERVDGLFRSLSGEHVTNAPDGFGRRMILAYMLNGYGSVDYRRAGLVNDLRAVIARFIGRDEPSYNSTGPVLERLKARWGEWVSIDGGAVRIRLYKKGTAHLEVHPDMAWRLNCVLAQLHPLAIPAQFRQRPKRRVRDFDLIKRPLPFQVVDALASLEAAYELAPEAERSGWRDNGMRKVRNGRRFRGGTSPEAVRLAEEVLAGIGGVRQPAGWWLFGYEPSDVLAEIVVSGCVPDARAHQFYPTPTALAERLVELAEIRDGDTVLEPSAGIGGLADLLPRERTLCVEISPLHARVLESKGYRVVCADFLAWEEAAPHFDRIVMNPPFSDGRWRAHVEAAARLLSPGGRLVAILPSGARNTEIRLGACAAAWSEVLSSQFPGVSVDVVLLALARESACSVRQAVAVEEVAA